MCSKTDGEKVTRSQYSQARFAVPRRAQFFQRRSARLFVSFFLRRFGSCGGRDGLHLVTSNSAQLIRALPCCVGPCRDTYASLFVVAFTKSTCLLLNLVRGRRRLSMRDSILTSLDRLLQLAGFLT